MVEKYVKFVFRILYDRDFVFFEEVPYPKIFGIKFRRRSSLMLRPHSCVIAFVKGFRPYKPGPVILRQAGQCGGPFVYHICTSRKTSFTKFVISYLPTKFYLCSVVLVWSNWRKQRKRILTLEKILKLCGGT